MITKKMAAKFYEAETGLNAKRGASRVTVLEKWMNDNNLSAADVLLFDDPNKSRRDFPKCIQWYAGKQNGDTIMLGYTNRGQKCVNAIYAQSDKAEPWGDWE